MMLAMEAFAKEVAFEYAALSMVEAVALGGSLTGPFGEPTSDFDLYVYSSTPVPLSAREEVARRRAVSCETGNDFWEPGDEWTEADGRRVDVMFRDMRWIEDQLARVLLRHEASIGYTTAFWFNVRNSKSLFDRSGWFADLQTTASAPYPENLRTNIVAKNYPILRNTQSSFTHQLGTAIERRDVVSANHRTAALLASFFDILFALNRQPHPGEKRLLRWADEICPLRPDGLDELVTKTIGQAAQCDPDALATIHILLDRLDDILRAEKLIA